MPFPNVRPDFETLFEPTRIWLFGKPFPTIEYVQTSMTGAGDVAGAGADATHANEFAPYTAPVAGTELGMPPRRIERALRRRQPNAAQNQPAVEPIFARIYSFSFEGHYYNLPRPLLFLVYGDGAVNNARRPEEPRVAGGVPFNTKFIGIEAKDWIFSDDIRMWQVDKKDLAVCLDVEVGNYQEVLLDSMVAFEEETASRGAVAGRGAVASRGAAASRGAVASRGAASFRGAMVGPHQEL